MTLETLLSSHCHTYLNQHTIHLPGKEISFYVHYWGATPNHYDNPVHKHSFFEVCYVIDGLGTYVDEKTHYPLKKETMFLSRPGIIHQIQSKTGLCLLFVAFEVIESESTDKGIQLFKELEHTEQIVKNVKEDSSSAELWKTLNLQATKLSIFKKEILMNLAFALLSSFHQTFTLHHEKAFEKSDILSSPLLHQAKLYIQDNLSQSLELKDVATYLHISSRHLTRLFSAAASGETFSSYVRRERIKKAMDLLVESDWPIKKIADETGFSSIHYFTRTFTSLVGISPGSYRKNSR